MEDRLSEDPLYKLFTDEDFQAFATSETETSPIATEELRELLIEMGVLFETEHPMGGTSVELNQHHELSTIMKDPHADRIFQDDVVAVLTMVLNTQYLPCLPNENIYETTGFEEERVDEAIDTLAKLRIIRRSMVGEGLEAKRNVVKSAGETLDQLDKISDLFEDNDEISVEKLDEIIDLETAKRDSPRVIAMTQDEFNARMSEAVAVGVDEMRTTDNISTVEAGSSGIIANDDSELLQALDRFQLYLTRHYNAVQSYTDD